MGSGHKDGGGAWGVVIRMGRGMGSGHKNVGGM